MNIIRCDRRGYLGRSWDVCRPYRDDDWCDTSYIYGIAAGGTIVLVAIGSYAAAKIGVRVKRAQTRRKHNRDVPSSTSTTVKPDGRDNE